MIMSAVRTVHRHWESAFSDPSYPRSRCFNHAHTHIFYFRSFLDGAFQPGSPRDDAPGGRRRREINLQEHPFGPALLAFLGGHPAFAQGGNGRGGQFGDYVFDQEGLDAVITQLMEANNANRPVPASEDLIRDLPRRKVTVQDYLDAAGEHLHILEGD